MTEMMRETPGLWAVHEDAIPEIQRNYAALAAGVVAGDDSRLKAETHFLAQVDDPRVTLVGSIAVVPICGPIFNRGNLYAYYFGGAVISVIRAQVRKALADDDVKAILLRVDSPGGMVEGVTEFAAELYRARATKPILAIADTMACSAAYWLPAAGATEITASPSALVGGVGVFMEHVSIAKMLEAEGIETTVIASSEEKVEDHRSRSLSDEAKAHKQALVDQMMQLFASDVARGREVTPKAIRDGYGKGRAFLAKAAQGMGLIDRVATFEETVQRLTGSGRRGGARAESESTEDMPAEPVAEVDTASAAERDREWAQAVSDRLDRDIDRHARL